MGWIVDAKSTLFQHLAEELHMIDKRPISVTFHNTYRPIVIYYVFVELHGEVIHDNPFSLADQVMVYSVQH